MFFIIPQWTPTNAALYILMTMLALAVGPMVYKMDSQSTQQALQKRTLPTRLAMLCLYGIPILVASVIVVPVRTTLSLVQTISVSAILSHFTKRCLEALFIHKYSARTALATTIPIAGFYTTVAGLGTYLALQAFPSADLFLWLGACLFIVGEAGNFIHHKLLADLRKGSLAYVIPHGGLFEYIACPHYLFELIAWLGIVLMSRHLFMGLAWVGMCGFLTARALLTLRWYRTEFPDFSKKRKALIPFVL